MNEIISANEKYKELPLFHLQEVFEDTFYEGDVHCNLAGIIALSKFGTRNILLEPPKLKMFAEQMSEYRFENSRDVRAVLRIVARNLKHFPNENLRMEIIEKLALRAGENKVIFGGNFLSIPMINGTLKFLQLEIEESAGPCSYCDLVLKFFEEEFCRITFDTDKGYITNPKDAQKLFKAINEWAGGKEDCFGKIFKALP